MEWRRGLASEAVGVDFRRAFLAERSVEVGKISPKVRSE